MILRLGNDVVDLVDAANQASAANPAFHRRVLSAAERARVPAGDARSLWAHWAAKEAAYKALKPEQPALVFAHRQFVVHTTSAFAETAGRASGRVRVGQQRVEVAWEWTREWIHCVTAATPKAVYRVATIASQRRAVGFVDLMRGNALSAESVAARVLARSMLDERGIQGAHIERAQGSPRAAPPVVVHPTQDVSAVSVSLSHDARFVAAALLVSGRGSGRTRGS